jgi:hypothetical protein
MQLIITPKQRTRSVPLNTFARLPETYDGYEMAVY